MARLPDKSSLPSRVPSATNRGGVSSAIREQIGATQDSLTPGRQAIAAKGAEGAVEARRGQVNAAAAQLEGQKKALPGAVVAAVSDIAVQAADRINKRQEYLARIDAKAEFSEYAQSELDRIQREGDITDTKQGSAYLESLDTRLGDIMNAYEGRSDARAVLEAELMGLRSQFSASLSQKATILRDAKVATAVQGEINKLSAIAWKNPERLADIEDQITAIAADTEGVMTQELQLKILEEGLSSARFQAVSGLIDKGAVAGAQRIINDNPDFFKRLSEQQSRTLLSAISAQKEQINKQALIDQGYDLELGYILGQAPDLITSLNYKAAKLAGNNTLDAAKIATGGTLTEEQANRLRDVDDGGRPLKGTTVMLADGSVVETAIEIEGDRKGQHYYWGVKGKEYVAFGEGGARSATASFSKPLSLTEFNDLENQFTDEKRDLARLARYWESQNGFEQGIEVWATKAGAVFNTLFKNGLTDEQFNLMSAEQQKNLLIGALRLETMGPGPVTEFDAGRIIESAGGNISAFQNKEVLKDALRTFYNEKVESAKLSHLQLMRGAPPNVRVAPWEPPDPFADGTNTNLGTESGRGDPSKIPQQAVDLLLSSPDEIGPTGKSFKEEFDIEFGEGMAEHYLKNQPKIENGE